MRELILFLGTTTHKRTTGVRFGEVCPNVPVALGWDLGHEAPAYQSLASGWHYLTGAEHDPAVEAETHPATVRAIREQGVAPGVALDACLRALREETGTDAAAGARLVAIVAHNTEYVLSVLRKFADHPLAAAVLDPAVRRVCLCWDPRVQDQGRPARFVDLCRRCGVEPGGVAGHVGPVVELWRALRADGTLGPVADMRHDSDPRTPLLFLHVPFADRAEAKKLGASFDFARRQWYLTVAQADLAAGDKVPAAWLTPPAPTPRKRDREDADDD